MQTVSAKRLVSYDEDANRFRQNGNEEALL
jgi:hypothetical protein